MYMYTSAICNISLTEMPDLKEISQKSCKKIFILSHIFATEARWWKFGFSSALKLNRLSGLTDPRSNIKSEKRRLLASFLFFPNIQSQILNHFWWGFIFRSVFLLRSVPIFYLYLKLQALRVCFVFIKMQSATQPLDPPAFPLSPVILV